MPVAQRSYFALIIKPTYACNLACSYCSVSGNNSLFKMTRQTVDKLFERVTDFCGTERPIYLIWHGGEPLLMGPDFYDYVGHKSKEYQAFKIVNSLQTNATLLNSEIIDILVKHRFSISTSIDGPAQIHDAFRKDADGNGTFDKVMKAISLLKAKNVPVGAVTVLTKTNKDHLLETYNLFNQKGVHLRINPVQLHGSALQNRQMVAISPKEYGQEMIRLFDVWYHDPEGKIVVDPFRIIIGNIITGDIYCCEFRRQCHAEVMSVGPNGNVYPCGQFSGQADFFLGNIHEQGFNDILNGSGLRPLLERIPENIETCHRCSYVEICNCGCTASAVCREKGIMQPDFYCAGRKMLYQHIIDTIHNDIEKVKRLSESTHRELYHGVI